MLPVRVPHPPRQMALRLMPSGAGEAALSCRARSVGSSVHAALPAPQAPGSRRRLDAVLSQACGR
eukprot:12945455-Alexandrium_andersonii.AAC.1